MTTSESSVEEISHDHELSLQALFCKKTLLIQQSPPFNIFSHVHKNLSKEDIQEYLKIKLFFWE